VADAGAGTSEVTLHLSFADGGEVAGHVSPEQIEPAMRESLDRLAREVDSTVNDAS
jgi:hypothetical protein